MDQYEIIDPGFRSLVLPNAKLLTLGKDFAWLEGPVWFDDANQLLVSDLPNDRVLRWTEDGGVFVFRQPSGFANGHARDRQGRLIRLFAPTPEYHPHRTGRQRDRFGGTLPRQTPEWPKRRCCA